ncbi:hypothetical protein EV359DRAFT_86430 [Lentinula novae-zelandiae]|nr:hypothetical protein EV359DRAFT_86430 [Lentinula novae-zelandiae]
MLTDDNSLLSSSSDLLSLLSECSHLTSFDLIPSTPPRTVSLGLDTANQQVLRRKFEDVQLDAVTLYICNVGFGGAGKGDRWGHYHTLRGPAARPKESPGNLKAASDVRTTTFDVVRKFPLNNFNKSSKDVFIRGKTTDKNITNENYTKGQHSVEGFKNIRGRFGFALKSSLPTENLYPALPDRTPCMIQTFQTVHQSLVVIVRPEAFVRVGHGRWRMEAVYAGNHSKYEDLDCFARS